MREEVWRIVSGGFVLCQLTVEENKAEKNKKISASKTTKLHRNDTFDKEMRIVISYQAFMLNAPAGGCSTCVIVVVGSSLNTV